MLPVQRLFSTNIAMHTRAYKYNFKHHLRTLLIPLVKFTTLGKQKKIAHAELGMYNKCKQ